MQAEQIRLAEPEATVSARRLEDLEDVKAWINEHDGRISAWWDEQRRINAHVDARCDRATCSGRELTKEIHARVDTVSARLGALERRVIWLTAVAACGGGLGGSWLAKLLF